MAYSPEIVAVGGIAHIPIIILFFKTIEKRFQSREIKFKSQT